MAAPKLAAIYYSSTGNTHAMAEAVAEGARAAGAEVRVLGVEETAPEAAIASNPGWKAHHEATKGAARVSHADIEWADRVIFGTPTRFGLMASQLKAFIDTTGGNPYGASATGTENGPSEAELGGARVAGQRVATVASWILKGRS